MLNNPGTAAMAKARVKDAKQGDLPALAAGWNVLTAAWLEVMNLQGEAITASPLAAGFSYSGEVTGSTRSPVPEVEVYCRNEGHKPPTDYD
jgi:hypothetical protein